jgi:hypothetical protein
VILSTKHEAWARSTKHEHKATTKKLGSAHFKWFVLTHLSETTYSVTCTFDKKSSYLAAWPSSDLSFNFHRPWALQLQDNFAVSSCVSEWQQLHQPYQCGNLPNLNIVLSSVSPLASKSCLCSNFSAKKRNTACLREIGEYKLSKDCFAP